MGRHLVLAGAGHAHLPAVRAIPALLKRGHRVTVIGPSDYHYYSGMSPGVLAGTYTPEQARFEVRSMVENRGASFIRSYVTGVDPGRRELLLQGGDRISYDVVSFNVGSVVRTERLHLAGEGVFPVKPIERVLEGRVAVLEEAGRLRTEPLDLAVVGGGPAGVEMAAALRRLAGTAGFEARVTLLTGGTLLEGFPARARDFARQVLARRGVTIREGVKVTGAGQGRVATQDGDEIPSAVTFLAVGIRPSHLFEKSMLPTAPDGGMLVDHTLRSVTHPEVMGGGDCVTLRGRPLARVGVYAVRQGPVLLHNMAACLEGTGMRRFDPGSPNFLLILNMGDGTGIFMKGGLVWRGRLAFSLKDFIDRRFMRKYKE